MRLVKARIRKYRSIRDTGQFELDPEKTILVGPNEAGKTAVLQALQYINPPSGTPTLDPLRDYPRSEYNDITSGNVKPDDVQIVEAWFSLEEDDKGAIAEPFRTALYRRATSLSNKKTHWFEGGAASVNFGAVSKDLNRLAAHMDARVPKAAEGQAQPAMPSASLAATVTGWLDSTILDEERSKALGSWLDSSLKYVDESNATEEARFDALKRATELAAARATALAVLDKRLPVFVLFNNYFRVRPLIHLAHLAQRVQSKILDDDQYDYGNECLLKLLGFTAKELSDLGNAAEPDPNNQAALKTYRDQLDKRSYQLNAASVRLTDSIVEVWRPDEKRDEAARLRIVADRQYLKAVVEDSLGVEIELNQRSEGFQWLVSFFVVFFAEAKDKHKNAILLLDEPGLSLHGLKQREFRETVSRLSKGNQTIYTTHSPFLVGPNELDLVRVVEMTDRRVGTKVHTTLSAGDPAGLLPLQEALGYDLAQSLFAQQRNLVLEGLTDYWYVDGVSQLFGDAGMTHITEQIALVPAASAGKVAYFATILHAHKLKVAALLDSDAAGDQAAKQDTLVHTLGNKRILRTKDAYSGSVVAPEVEDLLRDTLVGIAKSELGWDVSATATSQPTRPIVDIFQTEINGFSKYRLAKSFLKWSRDHKATDLTAEEQKQWQTLMAAIEKALK